MAFHWNYGWFFTRLEDGSVRVEHREGAREDGALIDSAVIDPHSWASIVASMSKGGEMQGRFYVALEFHGSEQAHPEAYPTSPPAGAGDQRP